VVERHLEQVLGEHEASDADALRHPTERLTRTACPAAARLPSFP
jgi:hypothetical protein